MRFIRLFPPTPGTSTTVHDRTYRGKAIDAPEHDAYVLSANGWVEYGHHDRHESGPTSARPNPAHGSFFDTDVGELVTWVPEPGSPGGRGGRWVDYDGDIA